MSVEAKVDGQDVEATVDETKEASEGGKEMTKKKANVKKILLGVAGALAGVGGLAWGIAKVVMSKNSEPEFSHYTDSEGNDVDVTEF